MQSPSQDGSGNNAQQRIAALLVKRSKARGMLGLWNDALNDADETIKMTPSSPWGYERRHAALHALQRYDEAIDAFSHMYSLIEESPNEEIRQLAKKYIAPTLLVTTIDDIIRKVSTTSPFVLIDVESGRLCNPPDRLNTFKLELQFRELLSSMTEELDGQRIQQVVVEYFQYVTLSHTWRLFGGREPSYQDVMAAGSVWELDSSSPNNKLRGFCEEVRGNGYRWAWCDTCCIDKVRMVDQSVTMMYKWYEGSAATFVWLADVATPSAANLKYSRWLTRSWTLLELLAPKVIRFCTRDWQPYLGDTRFNHKESPEIVEELAVTMAAFSDTITVFNPDSVDTREKLRLASTRDATVEEDVVYSLIGIFRSDIQPQYGEGGPVALGRLLEEIITRSGDVVAVLNWTGESSSYNSCLPANLAMYRQSPWPFLSIGDAEMDTSTASLRASLSPEDVMLVYHQITSLPPARFANRRLYLPCITFPVKQLTGLTSRVTHLSHRQEIPYSAQTSMLGEMRFWTSDELSEPDRLIVVHPWIHGLCDHPTWRNTTNDNGDNYTRGLRLLARLKQPFRALLLQQKVNGDFERVAAEQGILVGGLQIPSTSVRDIETRVMEIS